MFENLRINSPQYSNRNKRLGAVLAIAHELNIHFVEFDFLSTLTGVEVNQSQCLVAELLQG